MKTPYFSPSPHDPARSAPQQDPSPYTTSMNSDVTRLSDQLRPVSIRSSPQTEESPPSGGRSKSKAPEKSSRSPSSAGQMSAATDTAANASNETAASAKPKRVRTGCLTCRERHLKCDEGLPHCQNCRKSSRTCKRGVRLNFIDTQVKNPQIIPPTAEWNVGFQDESREIASEYKGGAGRYAAVVETLMSGVDNEPQHEGGGSILNAPTMAHQQLPPAHSHSHSQGGSMVYGNVQSNVQDEMRENHHHQHQHTHSMAESYSDHTLYGVSEVSYPDSDTILSTPDSTRDYLTASDECLLLQVFVEEVGLWMDSMDPHKHVGVSSLD